MGSIAVGLSGLQLPLIRSRERPEQEVARVALSGNGRLLRSQPGERLSVGTAGSVEACAAGGLLRGQLLLLLSGERRPVGEEGSVYPADSSGTRLWHIGIVELRAAEVGRQGAGGDGGGSDGADKVRVAHRLG